AVRKREIARGGDGLRRHHFDFPLAPRRVVVERVLLRRPPFGLENTGHSGRGIYLILRTAGRVRSARRIAANAPETRCGSPAAHSFRCAAAPSAPSSTPAAGACTPLRRSDRAPAAPGRGPRRPPPH